MYSHQLSVPHQLAQQHEHVAQSVQVEGNFSRGFLYALLFSIPIWGLIGWGVYALIR